MKDKTSEMKTSLAVVNKVSDNTLLIIDYHGLVAVVSFGDGYSRHAAKQVMDALGEQIQAEDQMAADKEMMLEGELAATLTEIDEKAN